MTQEREKVANFNGKAVVDHITQTENGKVVAEAWLTSPRKYNDEKNSLGAELIGVTENNRFAFMDAESTEIDSYRLPNSLKDKSTEEIIAQKHALLFFETWYPAESRWVKQCAIGTNKPKLKASAKA